MNTSSMSVTVVVLAYNSEATISRCLRSVETQSVSAEIILVDNGSTDCTIEIVQTLHPKVRIVATGHNHGYAKGNNLGIREATSQIVVVLNPDTEMLGEALRNLTAPIIADSRIMTTPLILLPDGRTVNVCGLYCTPSGLSFPRGLGLKPEDLRGIPDANGVSGCCFAASRSALIEIGGFDESFFMYNEDTDISWRAHLNGLDILAVTSSTVIHDYDQTVSLFKLFHLERNRYVLLRKCMPLKWMILYLPSLILTELLSLSAHCRFGAMGMKMKARAWMDSMNCSLAAEVGDHIRLREALIPRFPDAPAITETGVEKGVRRLASYIFHANWWFVR